MISAVVVFHLFTVLVTATGRQQSHHIAFVPKQTTPASRSSLPASTLEVEGSSKLGLPPSLSPTKVLFKNTNVNSRSFPVPYPEIWERCFDKHGNRGSVKTKSFWEAAANVFTEKRQEHAHAELVEDIEVNFEDPRIGAQALMYKCGLLTQRDGIDNSTISPETMMTEEENLNHLTKVLSYYQSVVSSNDAGELKSCKARIVSTVGSIGTKCPRWHADHVPVRLVMSLIGPGCHYIPLEMENCAIGGETIQVVNRFALNNLEEPDTSLANELIVPPEKVQMATKQSGKDVVNCAKAGDAVLLMGRGWLDESKSVLAAVHKSPGLVEGEKRILLTIDVADWDYSHQ